MAHVDLAKGRRIHEPNHWHRRTVLFGVPMTVCPNRQAAGTQFLALNKDPF